MARPDVENGEIGRGRQNDSSSSRESSPRRPQKRSFSPTSDDGDLVIPPIPDDDTPPPPERPLLRQPVGFAWNNSSSLSTAPPALNTYQASVPFTPSSSSAIFLPGQEVPSSLQPAPKARGSRAKKSDGKTVKKRRTAEYSGQTGRFRLESYDPTPSASPPLHHGQGPYSSMYRGNSSELTDRALNAASPTPTLSSLGGGYAGSVSSASSTIDLTRSKTVAQPSAKRLKPTVNRAKPPTGRAKAADAKAKPSAKGRASASASSNHVSTGNRNMMSAASRAATGAGHYRTDYEGSMPHVLDSHHSPESPAHSPFSEPRASNSVASSSTVPGSTTDLVDPAARRVFRQLRMVTLLIQDLRSGIADHQLAEVKIPLKAADDPQDGFWADAKELSEKLQASPARIDGPAKAYTLRGKYRQFFLRVTAENVDEYISANLVVKPDRTLDIVVETLPEPGVLPGPPQIPKDLRSPSPESSPSSPVPTQRQVFYDVFAGQKHNYAFPKGNRPQRSPSPWSDHSAEPHRRHSRTDHSSHESTVTRGTRASGSTSTAMPIDTASPSHGNRRYESPASDDEPEEVHKIISNAITPLIEDDGGWVDFFKARAATQRVSEVLKQYRFVQRMMDEWVGKRAPFRSHHVIEASHITHALAIEDSKYSLACTETLTLLALYGPQGQRCEDPRIVAMINDTRDPEPNAKPIKRMLRLLREIDEDWKANHSPGARASAGSASSVESSHTGP